jgi:hypothetical protein
MKDKFDYQFKSLDRHMNSLHQKNTKLRNFCLVLLLVLFGLSNLAGF